MSDGIQAFPLSWPMGWPRAKRRGRPRYTTDYSVALRHLLNELRLLGATRVVVSSNVPVRGDGLPYADAARRKQDDPGVAVYFVRFDTQNGSRQQVIACDKWDSVAGNIRALGLTVEGLRSIQRAGASELLNRAFDGFKALPPAMVVSEGGADWWLVLRVQRDAPLATVREAYRSLAAKHHPDHGGDAGAMAAINRAWEQAQEALRGAA